MGLVPLQKVIEAERMLELQKNLARAELYLKERHCRSFLEAFRELKNKHKLLKLD